MYGNVKIVQRLRKNFFVSYIFYFPSFMTNFKIYFLKGWYHLEEMTGVETMENFSSSRIRRL